MKCNMRREKINQVFYQVFNLPSYHIRKDLISFASGFHNPNLILDIGSGKYKPYQDIFNGTFHFGIDLFEPSDIKADICNLPICDAIADIVLCTEVLEHVPDPIVVLNEINRVLKRSGNLILTIPLVFGEHDHVDYQRWTEAGIRKLLAENGYNIIAFRRRGGLFSTIGCLIAQAPPHIFGEYRNQKCFFIRFLFVCTFFCASLIPWFLSIFDVFDRTKKFAFGFSVLCKK